MKNYSTNLNKNNILIKLLRLYCDNTKHQIRRPTLAGTLSLSTSEQSLIICMIMRKYIQLRKNILVCKYKRLFKYMCKFTKIKGQIFHGWCLSTINSETRESSVPKGNH